MNFWMFLTFRSLSKDSFFEILNIFIPNYSRMRDGFPRVLIMYVFKSCRFKD